MPYLPFHYVFQPDHVTHINTSVSRFGRPRKMSQRAVEHALYTGRHFHSWEEYHLEQFIITSYMGPKAHKFYLTDPIARRARGA